MEKLYIVTRRDLPPGAQLAQSCHAVSTFAFFWARKHGDWLQGANNIVCLAVANEVELECILQAAQGPCEAFREPDFGDSLTALALTDQDRKLLGHLPLALRLAEAA